MPSVFIAPETFNGKEKRIEQFRQLKDFFGIPQPVGQMPLASMHRPALQGLPEGASEIPNRLDYVNVIDGYDAEQDKYCDFPHCDIAVYNQPWDMPKAHVSAVLVRNGALPVTIAYSATMMHINPRALAHYKHVNKLYVPTLGSVESIQASLKNTKCTTVFKGWPRYDGYTSYPACADEVEWKGAGKRVIYSPHWSFADDYYKFGTFTWSGEVVYELAMQHPEISFCFRPHPTFDLYLKRALHWSVQEIEEFYNKWKSLPNAVVNKYDPPLPLLWSSDYLLTDCGGFSADYLMMNKPAVFIRRGDSLPSAALRLKAMSAGHECYSADELKQTFKEVIIEGKDSKTAYRNEMHKIMEQPKEGAARLILEDLLEIL